MSYIHQIEFIEGMEFSKIAEEGTMRNSLLETLDQISALNEWEVYGVEETVRTDGVKGILVFSRKPA